ncbi:hypothetical protein [Streptomyces sp. NPDC008240]|uniref:hypothetical protein n=1 Tax=Streptomyces sp. NPDC008240 TaxID=3364822 RepID=UPI0036EB2E82
MLVRATRAVWHRGMPAVVVATMAGAAGLTGAAPATAAQNTTVNCNADPGALQPAINAASPGSTLQVRGTCVGNFTIDKNLTLTGVQGAVLDGNHTGSVVTVTNGAQARLVAFTITDGHNFNGGGVLNINGGTTTLDRTTVTGNSSVFTGGGIFNDGTSKLTLTNSTVQHNTAVSTGGIDNRGTARLTRSTVRDNTSSSDSGGIYNGGSLTLNLSTVSGNTATSPGGGGIFNDGTLTMTRSTVRGNTADFGGGIYNRNAATLTLSSVVGNTANGGPGSGGGIFNSGGTVTLDRTLVRNNTPDNCSPENTIPGCTN